MLLLDFCNIKEWTCEGVLNLYKTHGIIHSEWGVRDGFEKFCVSKYRPVSEFMSQKLDLITLHGMVKEGGGNGGSP